MVQFGSGSKVAGSGAALATEHVHATLLLFEVVLLRAYDAARTADLQPAHGLARSKAVVFHEIQSDESACTATASKAVHGNNAPCLFGEAQEFVHDPVTGHFAVLEREVKVREASTPEDSC